MSRWLTKKSKNLVTDKVAEDNEFDNVLSIFKSGNNFSSLTSENLNKICPKRGVSPLHYLAKNGINLLGSEMEVMEIFNGLRDIMDIEVVDRFEGRNVLLFAAESGSVRLCEYLIKVCHANVHQKCEKFGRTILHIGAFKGYHGIVNFALSIGVDINCQDNINGHTPLHYAIDGNNLSVLCYLLNFGANPTVQSISGLSLVDYAKSVLDPTPKNIIFAIEKSIDDYNRDIEFYEKRGAISFEKISRKPLLKFSKSLKIEDFERVGDSYKHILTNKTVLFHEVIASTGDVLSIEKRLKDISGLDHPNICKLFGYLKKPPNIYVMVYEPMGTQFDIYIRQTHIEFSEYDISHIVRQILSILSYFQANQIRPHLNINICQFTISLNPDIFIKLSNLAGATNTAINTMVEYSAPETFILPIEKLTYSTDLWSLGVLTYYLASSGSYPFKGISDGEIAKSIRRFKDITSDVFSAINSCQDFEDAQTNFIHFSQFQLFLSELFKKDESQRPLNICDFLNSNEWLKSSKYRRLSRLKSIRTDDIAVNLEKFILKNKLAQSAQYIIAYNSTDYQELNSVFQSFDLNGDGMLSLTEIKQGLALANIQDGANEFTESIFALLDQDGSGCIDYSEFIAAAMNEKQVEMVDNLKLAFNVFDTDGSGKISASEIREALLRTSPVSSEDEVDEIIQKYDVNGDGEIDFEEFTNMMIDSFT